MIHMKFHVVPDKDMRTILDVVDMKVTKEGRTFLRRNDYR